MMEAFRHWLHLDEQLLHFIAWYFSVGFVLVAVDFVWRRTRGRRRGAAPARGRRNDPWLIARAKGFGQAIVHTLAVLPVTPNQVTVIGIVLVLFNCVIFALTRDAFSFGCGLVGAVLFDTLDGQVARAQGSFSHLGAYLDAVIDRYQEVVIYLTIAIVLDYWLPAFLIITGSLITSYNKARLALEIESDNKSWPDLLERPMRLVILCVGLISVPMLSWFLPLSLWMLVVMTHFTAIQRFTRACFRLAEVDPKP